MGLGSLSGDIYIINLIGGATELVSYCIAFLVIPGGRKVIYISLLAAGGVGLVTAAIVQEFSPSEILFILFFSKILLKLLACKKVNELHNRLRVSDYCRNVTRI